jgi:hypothetical protein
MIGPISNQPHMNPGSVPLQQPTSGHMGLPGESIENHLGSFANLGSSFANLGSTTNLHALSITSHLDNIVPKIEPGITTIAGAGGVSTMAQMLLCGHGANIWEYCCPTPENLDSLRG